MKKDRTKATATKKVFVYGERTYMKVESIRIVWARSENAMRFVIAVRVCLLYTAYIHGIPTIL